MNSKIFNAVHLTLWKDREKEGIVMIKLNKKNQTWLKKARFSEVLKYLSDNKFRYDPEKDIEGMISFHKFDERNRKSIMYALILRRDEFAVICHEYPVILHTGLTDKLQRHDIEKLSKINISELLNLYSEIAK